MVVRPLVAVTLLALPLACKTPAPQAAALKDDTTPSPAADAPPSCTFVKEYGKTKRYACPVKGKTVHMLVQEGSFFENSKAHGVLFAKELERSTLAQITAEIHGFVKDRTPSEQELVKTLLGCLTDRLHESVSQEFHDATEAAYAGYLEGMAAEGLTPKYSKRDVLISNYGIEMGVLLDGIRERVQFGGPVKAAAAITDVVKQCGGTMKEAIAKNFFGVVSEEALRAMSFSRGCSGFVADGTMTKDGALIHARNMDGDVVESWTNDPVLFLIKEPGEGNYPFVATAAVGAIYPGGVSGFNAQGISVSIHEMSTINYKLYMADRKTDIAPYVLQRILRNAGSIDDAVRIAQGMPHIAAWTILVSDGQRNESASIEFSSDKVRVSRRVKGEPLGQANHFLDPAMADQAYTPKFNKTMESRSRFDTLTRQLAAARAQGKVVDVPWAMFHIAGHEDSMGKFRSFGRTVAKNYTATSTVAVPWKTGAGQLPELWFSIGDRRPVPHSHFVGFGVDLAKLEAKPIGVSRNDWGKPHWERSIATAIKAKHAAHEKKDAEAVTLLTQAIGEAKQDGIDEIPYYFMRARMLQIVGDHARAMDDWNWLWQQKAEVDDYQQALIALHGVISSDQASGDKKLAAAERVARAKFAATKLKNLYADENHTDLKKKWDMAKDLVAGKPVKTVPSPDFAILE